MEMVSPTCSTVYSKDICSLLPQDSPFKMQTDTAKSRNQGGQVPDKKFSCDDENPCLTKESVP
jgi:hypothetical protein